MKKKMLRHIGVISFLLLIPLALTLLSNYTSQLQWNWGLGDFVFAFVLPLSAAFLYEITAQHLTNGRHRVILAGVLVAALCVVWVEMATGGLSRQIKTFF